MNCPGISGLCLQDREQLLKVADREVSQQVSSALWESWTGIAASVLRSIMEHVLHFLIHKMGQCSHKVGPVPFLAHTLPVRLL